MSIAKIRQALEIQLATVTPPIHTVAENASYTPTAGAPYQRVSLIPADTLNPTFGDKFRREQGILQVTLCYPTGGGSGDAMAQAELIRAAFPRGSSFTAGGVTVQIDRTPSVSAGIIDGDRYCVPVRVRYFANIQT